mgnify:CR=1 FL=1
MVGLEWSLQIIEPWNGWLGRVLTDHRDMEWLDWKGPYRSQTHAMIGSEGSIKPRELWNGWVGRVLTDHRDIEW